MIGLKSSDHVLVIGNPAFLTWLPPVFERYPEHLKSARKHSQIDAIVRSGEQFDKLILTRETAYTHEHTLYAGALRAQLVVFPRSEGDAFHVEQSVEFYYPGARIWKLDSTFGPVLVAEPYGASWRIVHA